MWYERTASFVPRPIRLAFKRELNYLNISIGEKKFVGFLFAFSLAVGFALALNLFLFFALPFLSVFLGFFVAAVGITYAWLYFSSLSRGRFVERILPDALQLIAANLSAGLTIDKALAASARKEFGPLATELRRTSGKIIAGTPVIKALAEMPKHVRSKIFEKTIWLMAEGIESGGELSSLLIQLSEDIRRRHAVQQEVKANVSVYMMLIFFAAIIAAPVLIGISTFIVKVTAARVAALELPTALPTIGQRALITPGKGMSSDFIDFFSTIMVFVAAVFSSLTIGVISAGRESEGLKFLPVLVVLSLIVFFAVRFALHIIFAGIL